ncbi:hypothetical protein [Mucilaginibacter agri]|uniref:hypothetical protein n=1 Tax=Mucilaginibacter agri TaxID=2695265 RepID=UPI001AA1C1CD|nr:hypothetical protein [Mucilaginibacter agri]
MKIKFSLYKTGGVAAIQNYNNKQDQHVFKYATLRTQQQPDEGVTIENADRFPSNNTLVFSLIQNPFRKQTSPNKYSPYNSNHDEVTIHVVNNRSNQLIIKRAVFSDNGLWSIKKINNLLVDATVFPITIDRNCTADITIAFTADAIKEKVHPFWWKGIFRMQYYLLAAGKSLNLQSDIINNSFNINGNLCLDTNDEFEPVKVIYLNSIWQYNGEGFWEPELQRIITAFNLKTNIGFKNFDNGINGDKITPMSDEVEADYLEKANLGMPVKITQLAAYHGCCLASDIDTLKFYTSTNAKPQNILYPVAQAGQTILPGLKDKNRYALFNPTEWFGLKIGSSYLTRKMNFENKIGVRVWKAFDYFGKRIENCYIVGSDYLGTPGTNYDYQDNVYYLENVRPIRVLRN